MSPKFSWFPGHMKATLDKLAGEYRAASLVMVILDARCPRSSQNPVLEAVFKDKPKIYILNKVDLASQKITHQWLDYYKEQGIETLGVSCYERSGRKKLMGIILQHKDRFEKNRSRRRQAQPFRIVVIGIPNAGKSSIINLLSTTGKTVKTGKKPGLTRGKQWLTISPGLEILDSPGVMLPRMDREDTPWILGATAAIKQEILPVEDIAASFLQFLIKNDLLPEDLVKEETPSDPYGMLSQIAVERGFLHKGGEPDIAKASLVLLKIFREGKLGRLSLEIP